ncbi:hypothetical protein [Moritella sp. F3]|uniref:hypothetical protein n=1 Tax=Moritella sp. F3 TaxID=2718882 RepID=UPI0018E180B6|nr:hypothetical protein [Moritella sp. F3]GIC77604.1 hypothetical protein FMO001_23310 [Moritella sp. F1]GIC82017.1 hypothetical protein FMO003_22980 [Moritella sp. F3]
MLNDNHKFMQLMMDINSSMTSSSLLLNPDEDIFERIVQSVSQPTNKGKTAYFHILTKSVMGENHCFYVHGMKTSVSIVDESGVEISELGFELEPSSSEIYNDDLLIKARDLISKFLLDNPDVINSCFVVDESLIEWASRQVTKLNINGLIIRMKRSDISSCLFDKFSYAKVELVPYLVRHLTSLGDTYNNILSRSDKILITEGRDHCFKANFGDRELLQNNFLTLRTTPDFHLFDQYLLALNKSTRFRSIKKPDHHK